MPIKAPTKITVSKSPRLCSVNLCLLQAFAMWNGQWSTCSKPRQNKIVDNREGRRGWEVQVELGRFSHGVLQLCCVVIAIVVVVLFLFLAKHQFCRGLGYVNQLLAVVGGGSVVAGCCLFVCLFD